MYRLFNFIDGTNTAPNEVVADAERSEQYLRSLAEALCRHVDIKKLLRNYVHSFLSSLFKLLKFM